MAPIIKGVHLSCPIDRFAIANRPEGRSSNQVVVAADQIAGCKARRGRETASFDLMLGVEPPSVECGDGSKCVFVTSTTRDGDFGLDDPDGALAFADAECNALAESGGLPGPYMAWLSDNTGSPSTRFTRASIPYALVDGTQVADDWTDLTTCDGACLDNPISLTENGSTASETTWTGTRENGAKSFQISCTDWTNIADLRSGTIGTTSSTDYRWTGANAVSVGAEHCPNSYAFYCFQQ